MAIYMERERLSSQSTVIRAQRKMADYAQQDVAPEETFVLDDRGSLRPEQMIERKLTGILPEACLPVSQLRYSELISRRS